MAWRGVNRGLTRMRDTMVGRRPRRDFWSLLRPGRRPLPARYNGTRVGIAADSGHRHIFVNDQYRHTVPFRVTNTSRPSLRLSAISNGGIL